MVIHGILAVAAAVIFGFAAFQSSEKARKGLLLSLGLAALVAGLGTNLAFVGAATGLVSSYITAIAGGGALALAALVTIDETRKVTRRR